ncbi:MAG: hypothetical protein FWE06_05310 [Oscillospiraceae bacterium]|nr:hypothetical protein [Oscillospiraceae bacterium]
MTDTSMNQPTNGVSPKTQKYFSVFLAMYPILCVYRAFFRFTVGDIILMAFFMMSLKYPIQKDKRLTVAAIFCGYALFMLFINLLFSPIAATQVTSALIFRMIRFIFYILCVFTCGRRYFNIEVFRKALFTIATAACFFLFFQYIMFHMYGQVVLGWIPGLLYLEDVALIDFAGRFYWQFRPGSFFLEPAHFSRFVIVALILALFTNNLSKKLRVFLIFLFTIGILMSTAGQGVLNLIIVYAVFGFRGIKNKGAALFFFILAVIVALASYNNIEVVRDSVDRLLFNEQAADARLSGYEYVFGMRFIPSFFGHGYGVVPDNAWMPGAAYVWYGTGLIGLILSFGIFGAFYWQGNNMIAKTICLIFLASFFGSGTFYSHPLFWFLAITLCTSSLKKSDDERVLENKMYVNGTALENGGTICQNT